MTTKKSYLVLDRRFRNSESDDRTIMTWYLHTQKGRPDGAYLSSKVKNITKIKILDMTVGNTLFVDDPSAISAKPAREQIFVLIHNLKSQSAIRDNTVARSFYHFSGNVYSAIVTRNIDLIGVLANNIYSNSMVICFDTFANDFNRFDLSIENVGLSTETLLHHTQPLFTINNQNEFIFDPPITDLNEISLAFNFIDRPIAFPPDVVKISYLNAQQIPFDFGRWYIIIELDIPAEFDALLRFYLSNTSYHIVFTQLTSTVTTDLETSRLQYIMQQQGWAINYVAGVQYVCAPIYSEYKDFNYDPNFTTTGNITGTAYINFGEYIVELEIDYNDNIEVEDK